ncbi:CD206 [Mytilus edulis]|uniref:MRC n=1 Tax=Mytilus edulis TaxID=6550 RepID=A0A8S3RJ83_MYTED|nr:CD206 [Mytilus edulis]
MSSFQWRYTYAKSPCHFYDVVEYSSSRDTWEKAREYCQSNGGDLVMIDNPREDHRIQKFLEDVKNKKTGDGWYIGAKYVDGEWRMADGSPMWYTNFPKYHVLTESIQSLYTTSVQRITNYAAIFYDVSAHGYETYNWGYMSPRDRSKLGSICKLTLC